MTEQEKLDLLERYMSAAHGMQTGVAYKMEYDAGDTTPKHLRVGVNSAMVDSYTIARLLIEKGIFTEEEYLTTQAEEMERERDSYKQWLERYLGTGVNITLG
jgi:hypothetical protein